MTDCPAIELRLGLGFVCHSLALPSGVYVGVRLARHCRHPSDLVRAASSARSELHWERETSDTRQGREDSPDVADHPRAGPASAKTLPPPPF